MATKTDLELTFMCVYSLSYTDLIEIKNKMSVGEFNDYGHDAIVLTKNIEDGLLNCDLLIVFGGANRYIII